MIASKREINENWEKYSSIWMKLYDLYFLACIRSFEKFNIEKLSCCFFNISTEFSNVTRRTTTNLKFWSRKSDRLWQSHLESFLDRERKTPLEKTITIQPDDCADIRQCPEIREPRFSIKLLLDRSTLREETPRRVVHLIVLVDNSRS